MPSWLPAGVWLYEDAITAAHLDNHTVAARSTNAVCSE